jgi:hypothetical protein
MLRMEVVKLKKALFMKTQMSSLRAKDESSSFNSNYQEPPEESRQRKAFLSRFVVEDANEEGMGSYSPREDQR